MYSFLCSVAGFSSSFSKFFNCSSSRQSASVFADYLRSHFTVSQPKALRSRAKGYLFELHRVTCPDVSHSSFCSPPSFTKLLAAAYNFFLLHCQWPRQSCLSHAKAPSSPGVDFFLHIFNLSWTLHSFPSIWKTSSIIPIHKMEMTLGSPASFRPTSLTSCVLKLFERIILSRNASFWSLISFSLPARLVFALYGLLLIKFYIFLSPSRMGLTKVSQPLGRFLQLSIFPKLLTLSGIPPFSINLFRLASLLALLISLNLSFLISAPAWFFKIKKVDPFESVEVFRKDPFLALYFSFSSLMIFLLLCLFPSAARSMLTIWRFVPPPSRSLPMWRPHKEL